MVRSLLALLFLFSSTSYAFTLNNSAAASFKSNGVAVNVANLACDNIGYTGAQLLDLVNEAVDQFWNRAPTSRLKLKKGSLQSVAAAFKTDAACQTGTSCEINATLKVSSDILISCNNSSDNFAASSGVLGLTVPNNISGKDISGSLFLINDRADTRVDNLTRAELVAFIAHELGHAIGLGHSPVVDSLMYYRSIPTRGALGWDDIDGVTYLYPKQQPDLGINCATINTNRTEMSSLFLGLFIALALSRVFYTLSRKRADT